MTSKVLLYINKINLAKNIDSDGWNKSCRSKKRLHLETEWTVPPLEMGVEMMKWKHGWMGPDALQN